MGVEWIVGIILDNYLEKFFKEISMDFSVTLLLVYNVLAYIFCNYEFK